MKKCLIIFYCLTLAACGTQAQNREEQTQTPIQMDADVITLVAPQESGATLLGAMMARASVREYADRDLTLEQLSGVLWATSGRNRPDGLRTTPSSMGLYPLRVYAVLPTGIYLYSTEEHNLTLVKKGDSRSLAGTQSFVHRAPLSLVYVTDLNLFEARPFYPTDEERFFVSGLDAGHYSQSVNLWAAANGMGAVTRGMIDGAEFLESLDLPAHYRVVLAQTVGVLK